MLETLLPTLLGILIMVFGLHLLGGFKKDYFKEKFIPLATRGFLKHFLIALVLFSSLMSSLAFLNSCFPTLSEYSIYSDDTKDETIIKFEEGKLIKIEEGVVSDASIFTEWGVGKVLSLIGMLLMFYSLPIVADFFLRVGHSYDKPIDVAKLAFYVLFFVLLGYSPVNALCWILFFTFIDYRYYVVSRRLFNKGLSIDKIDEEFTFILAPYCFWFIFIGTSIVCLINLL